MSEFISFDAKTVKLQESNLIEASAGTGKTYSIAILVLRLLLEKQIPINEILMVTFTKAAVAELEERVRLFVRQANRAAHGDAVGDPTIALIVSERIAADSLTDVQRLLREAMLMLDEIPVMTIHSFCQKTLSQFAFETRQLFNAETLESNAVIIADEVNKFWRRSVTTIPENLLQILLRDSFTRDEIQKVVTKHLGGKRYEFYDENKSYGYCAEDHEKIIAELEEIGRKKEQLTDNVYAYIKNNEAKIRADIMADTYAKKSPAATYKEPQQLIDFVSGKLKSTKVPGYIDKIFGEISQYCDDCAKVDTDIEIRIEQVISDLFCQAIGAVQQGFRNYMLRNNMLSYDELITRLHEALTSRDNPGLISSLREKYKSVFIDEFQDTDRLQYEIFHTVFGEETILFYIGDPKQSIYAFRTADIFTYFQAGKQVKHHYTMNTNYRSSKGFIDAMNEFFKPKPDFDTFHFGQAEDRIDYHRVDSPAENAKGGFLKDGVAIAPMPVAEDGSKPKIMEAVVAQVIDLLSGGYSIRAKGKERPVTPADIGILVRANKDGRQLKSLLARFNIPAVNVNDDRILNSDEAPWMLYLLQAMLDPSKGSINRALKSPLTGLKTENILRLDDEKILTAFRHYREKWISEGIYSATATFMADFGVQSVLLDSGLANGDRMIANLLQLVELLHKVQSRRQLSPLELVNWFQRGIEGLELLGDEYEQRIESDEEAIRIVTIHKSKGLEYNIVLAPFLDFTISDKDNLLSFRNPETKSYRTIQRALRTAEHDRWVAEQTEQEHRRLVYVAITRAVYACYLYRSTANNAKNSTLSAFVEAIDYASTDLIVKLDAPVLDNAFRYRQSQVQKTKASPEPVNFQLNENNWARMSYTMLAKKGEIVSRARASAQQEAFEDFMFRGLERGNKTGNLLHQIFENANFSNAERWPQVIAEALRQHAPKHLESYPPLLTELLDQICHAEINVDGQTLQLSQVNYEHRLHEFEFDFLVDQYNPYALNSLSTGEAEIRVGWDTPLQGILNGKMDLFFEYAGKYYVLDWKSNYLGDRLEDYSAVPLVNAMNENNYHLQYLIYTLAAKKYLETRLPQFNYGAHFGGVIYLFVRGVRRTGDTGIYVNVPKLETIQKLENILAGKVQV